MKTILKAESERTGDKTIGRGKPGRPKLEELKLNEGLLEFYKILAKEFVVGARKRHPGIKCSSLYKEKLFLLKQKMFQ